MVVRRSSPHIIKVKNKFLNQNNDIDIQRELKKSNSNENIFNSGIIKLIKCQEI